MEQRIYRGKRKDEPDKWAEGWYAVENWKTPKQHFIINLGRRYDVIPKTVGQATGLKDKNGVEIWEANIYEYDNPNSGYCDPTQPERLRVVVPPIDELLVHEDFDHLMNIFQKSGDCVGSIHDNPEPLHD